MRSINFKRFVLEAVSFLYILLFVYAAVSKALEFENFQTQLGQSPLLSSYAGVISYCIIIIEIIIAILLAVPALRFAGLYACFFLMALFTSYIVIIMNYSSYVPCSCGGILENMGWGEHLIFNIVFTVLGATAILISSFINENQVRDTNATLKIKRIRMRIIHLLILTLIGFLVMMILYYQSEKKMHYENPFIRRFIEGVATKMEERDLNSRFLYFAGSDKGKIFIGDNLAPLHLLEYDSLLRQTGHHKITLEREDFPFRSVQVRISAPYFFLSDGTVPVIFRGKTDNWKASLLMSKTPFYFSKTEIIDSVTLAYRARQNRTLNNELGTLHFGDTITITPNATLLQKQIDGFFDTDGTMHYNKESGELLYTYFYRNQYIVADNTLSLKLRGKTIDTTSRAEIKIAFIKDKHQRKLASPPKTVNNLTASSGNLLYVHSKVMGRYQSKKMWDTASVIDIYDVSHNKYLSSIYLYNVEDESVRDFIVQGNHLYALVGKYVHHYLLNQEQLK